ncbi:hypothetical protein [Rhizobium subbaraonis]|nr:hypothetical protein [Rhizobium subbaraonis]
MGKSPVELQPDFFSSGRIGEPVCNPRQLTRRLIAAATVLLD